MENKINIAELLKDCPKGMELDCTMYEDVCFDYVDELNIIHCYIQHEAHKTSITFNQHGTPNSDIKSKCVIFPKGKTTWEGFQRPFKDGDILAYTSSHTTVFIYRNKDNKPKYTTSFYVGYSIGESYCSFHIYNKDAAIALNGNCDVRLATEEEKAKLFKAIKDNGYRWDNETKTLEKLPKFKVGDRVKKKDSNEDIVLITDIADNYYIVETKYGMEVTISMSIQNNYELVPDKFDINTLKPFDKVLVRDFDNTPWEIDFFSRLLDGKHFKCVDLFYVQCIPYEENKHLLGTTNDCDEYYKTW